MLFTIAIVVHSATLAVMAERQCVCIGFSVAGGRVRRQWSCERVRRSAPSSFSLSLRAWSAMRGSLLPCSISSCKCACGGIGPSLRMLRRVEQRFQAGPRLTRSKRPSSSRSESSTPEASIRLPSLRSRSSRRRRTGNTSPSGCLPISCPVDCLREARRQPRRKCNRRKTLIFLHY